MKAASLLLLLCGSLALGLFLGWRRLRRLPNKPMHSAVHLLLGVAALQVMAMLRRGAPDGTVVAGGVLGTLAAILLLAALLSALLSCLLAGIIGRQGLRRPANTALVAHATLATGGFIVFVAWLVQAPWPGS